MKTHTVTIGGKHLGLILKAFSMIQGPRPIMLSYKIGRIQEPVLDLQKEFVQRIQPYVNEMGGLKPDLTDEEKTVVEEILNEDLSFEVPTMLLKEFFVSELKVEDNSVLPYLVDIGVVKE